MNHACYLILEGPDGQLLLRQHATARALPHVVLPGDWLAEEAEPLRHQVREALGLEVTVLRQLPSSTGELGVELESHSPAWAPPADMAFHDVSLFAERQFLPPPQRLLVEAWLEDRRARAAPWLGRGWFAEAVAWMDARLHAEGLERQGPVRQVKAAWVGSAVLAATTRAGDFYFKATRGVPGEARVVRELSERWAAWLLDVVAVEPERGWLLSRDMRGVAPDEAAQAEALRRLAELQVGEARRLERWRALGCPERGPEVLAARAPRLLVDLPRLLARAGVLDEAQATELAHFEPRVQALCARLADLGLPRSLHHEDFRPGNVRHSARGPLLFDWEDSVLAHPFFSLQRFLDDVEPPAGVARWDWRLPDEDPRAALRDAYLAPWSALAPRPLLLEAFVLTRQLQGLYQVLRYDAAVDLPAWLRAGPAPAELELARFVFSTVLEVSRAVAPPSP